MFSIMCSKTAFQENTFVSATLQNKILDFLPENKHGCTYGKVFHEQVTVTI